ncbi:MAG: type II secretion system minor pseudopilin GspH [Pseudomonadota bacterium]
MEFRACKTSGFTLIEILVVVVVIAILMSVVIGSFTGADRAQEYNGYMQRLALKVEMARDKAVQKNREWGMHISEEGITFSEFDEINGSWITQSQRPFGSSDFANELEFELEVEAFAGIEISPELFNSDEEEGFSLDDEVDKNFPDVILFSSGEATPFELAAQPKSFEGEVLVLETDGFMRTRVRKASDRGFEDGQNAYR